MAVVELSEETWEVLAKYNLLFAVGTGAVLTLSVSLTDNTLLVVENAFLFAVFAFVERWASYSM